MRDDSRREIKQPTKHFGFKLLWHIESHGGPVGGENKMYDSLKKTLLLYVKLKYPHWVGGMELERYTLHCGRKAANGGRRLRELVNEGHLERRIVAGYVEYCYKPLVPIREEQRERQEAISHYR